MRNETFKEIGDNVTIYQPVSLIQPEKFVLKSNIILSEFSYLAAGKGLYIGNYIHISTNCSILGGGYCILNDFVGFSAGSRIITGTENIMGEGLTGGPTIPKEFRSNVQSYVILKKHAFLGTNCVVLPGVTIGEGAVIASGSVVTRDVEPWTINMGVPAKKIKERPRKKILEFEKQLFRKYGVCPSDFSEYEKIALSLKE